ncbi:MAG TPA: hypothetical protein DD729_06185 [Rhodobacteraceae bacterium]|jgi:uncharacterized protein (DUF697 family)|nr:hypothetical protein [Paracoccaceae bacterium]
MKQQLLTLSLGIGAILLSTQQIFGQSSNCAAHQTVVDRLAQSYGETRKSIGLSQNNVVLEVFASEKTGSWTITITTANGITCLVASGQAFETIRDAPETQSARDM